MCALCMLDVVVVVRLVSSKSLQQSQSSPGPQQQRSVYSSRTPTCTLSAGHGSHLL